ncbi:MATE family efflux transporter [Kordiimonas aquimaris]|uniref:MATE family efflux transporter n=1 Tax=Kordiimonas aquimaris TaxID=707591 RepID=UPI0021CE542B|nr:MATE family efflux transporter [Kordiimonas aquimaris]
MHISGGAGKASIHQPNRQIWAIAGPAIIANSSTPIVGLVDTWAIGHLPGAVHLAAVGVGATVFSYVFWAFGFLRMGTTGLVAQANGRKDIDSIIRIVARSLVFGSFVAVCLIALQALLFRASIAALAPPDTTVTLYATYFDIRIWSAPAILIIYGITGYLIGVARAKAALVLQLILNTANVGLNLLFVLGLNMGVEGIALGSLLAEWLAAISGLTIIARHFGARRLATEFCTSAFWRLRGFFELAQTNGYIFVRTLLLMTALSLVTREAGLISEQALAASHVLNIFMLLISLGLDGFAYAVEALAGAAYGKGAKREFAFWVSATSKWALFAALLYTIIFYVMGDTIIALLTNNADVRAAAESALIAIIWLPFASVWCYQLDGIFIGATATRAMMMTMAISFIVFISIAGVLSVNWGLKGLWTAVVIFSACRGITQIIYYPYILRKLNPKA